MRYHTIPGGAFTSANLTSGLNLTTGLASEDNLTVVMLPGGNITFFSTPKLNSDSPLALGSASNSNSAANGTITTVLVPDIRWQATGAAVIHVVDTVLIPPTMKQIWDELGAAYVGRTVGKTPGGDIPRVLPKEGARFRAGVGAPAGEYGFGAPAREYDRFAPAGEFGVGAPAGEFDNFAPAPEFSGRYAPAGEFDRLAPAGEFGLGAPAGEFGGVAPAGEFGHLAPAGELGSLAPAEEFTGRFAPAGEFGVGTLAGEFGRLAPAEEDNVGAPAGDAGL